MPGPTKPTKHINWGVGNVDPVNRIVEPADSKKVLGWLDDEQPPAPIFNWLFFVVDAWQHYFESVTDQIANRYDAVVADISDPSSTHATLQAAVNDVTLGTDKVILVKNSVTINTMISMTKARWRVFCNPGVVFTRGSVPNGISLEAEGIEFNYGRFVGFTTVGDKAITMTSAAEYCKIIGTRFAPTTDTEVDDTLAPAGKKPVIAQTISEV